MLLLLCMCGAYETTRCACGSKQLDNVAYCQRISTDEIPWWASGASFCKWRFHHLASQAQHTLEEESPENASIHKCRLIPFSRFDSVFGVLPALDSWGRATECPTLPRLCSRLCSILSLGCQIKQHSRRPSCEAGLIVSNQQIGLSHRHCIVSY